MRGAVLHAPRDIRVEHRDDPTIEKPTDAIIRLAATCVCGSDQWPYRGIEPVSGPAPMGHEYAGVVEEVGTDVRTIRPGQFVVGSFFASDNSCEICQAGYQSRCVHAELIGAIGTQAEYARIPLADGTLVATPGVPFFDARQLRCGADRAWCQARRRLERRQAAVGSHTRPSLASRSREPPPITDMNKGRPRLRLTAEYRRA